MAYALTGLFLLIAIRLWWFFKDQKQNYISQGDSIGHLNYLMEYQRSKGKPLDLSWLYILDGPDYPNGFHKLIYSLRISTKLAERYGGLLPIVADVCLYILTVIAVQTFGNEHMVWLLAIPFSRVLFGNSGRAHHFSERAYGGFLSNLYLFSIVGFYLSNNVYWLAISTFSFLLFSISSKFSWQATAFVSIVLSAFTMDVYFVLAYIAIAALSMILSRGYALKVLIGLLRHSFFYKTYLAFRLPTSIHENYTELFKYRNLKHFILKILLNSPFRSISDLPVILFILLNLKIDQLTNDIWLLWSMCGPFLVLLISTKTLAFLGEPERYLEFSIIPAFVWLSNISPTSQPLTTTLSLSLLALIFLFHTLTTIRNQGGQSEKQKNMVELREYWADINGANVVTIPFRLSFYLGYKNAHNRYLTLLSNIGTGEAGKDYQWLIKDRYPFVRNDLMRVIDKHNLDYIVVDKDAANSMNNVFNEPYYDFAKYPCVFENAFYAVYRTTA